MAGPGSSRPKPLDAAQVGSTVATLSVRVVPRAGRSAVAGRRGEALLVRLAAPPVDGAANEALVAFLAGALDRPRHSIRIVSGERSRNKRLRMDGLAPDELDRRIAGLLDHTT